MDTAQARRFAELLTYLLYEFKDDHRDPVTRLAGVFPSREIRLADDTPDGERWVEVKLTERELATMDLRKLAKSLYAVYTGR